MNELHGQVAIVTGGSKGIGRAIGRALAKQGAHVVLLARTGPVLEATVREFTREGLAVSGRQADVTDPAQVRDAVEAVAQGQGRIDILVNNAGMGVLKTVADLSLEEFDTMWKVNMRGVFITTKAVLPIMTRAARGNIVNISSLAGKNSFKGGAGYSATKWALRAFASSLMLEVREHNIRVVTIFPGSVDTSFSAGGKKGSHITQPEDVADAVVFAVTAPARSMFSEIDVRPTKPG